MTTTDPTTTDPTAHGHGVARVARLARVLLLANGVGNALAGGPPLLLLAGGLAEPTGLPSRWLTAIGVFYLVHGGAMWFAASRARPRPAAIVALIAVNPVWACACLLLLVAGWSRLTTLGALALAGEAAFVTVLGAAQWVTHRRSRRPR